MAERRVFAGYYKRCDGKPIFVVRVLRDIDTGEAIVDGAFQESVLRSAPYFSLRIDGITELNNN